MSQSIQDRIRSRDFRKRERVEAFGEAIAVQQLSVLESREFRRLAAAAQADEAATEADKWNELFVLANLHGAVDAESGERVFGWEGAADWLRAQPSEALAPVAVAFLKLNGMTDSAAEEAEGNSSATQTDGSPTP